MRLHEAQEKAQKQSKLAHKTAKRYYDKKTRNTQLQKGDLVYIYIYI
jgi:hypothetical protein